MNSINALKYVCRTGGTHKSLTDLSSVIRQISLTTQIGYYNTEARYRAFEDDDADSAFESERRPQRSDEFQEPRFRERDIGHGRHGDDFRPHRGGNFGHDRHRDGFTSRRGNFAHDGQQHDFRFRDDYRSRSSDFGQDLQKQDFSDMPPIKKNVYTEHPNVSERSETDVQAYREAAEMKLQAKIPIPRPIQSFKEGCFPAVLERKMIEEWGEPTPIQAQGWPVVMSGHDCVGIARTGSGKTAAFIMPAIVHILNQDVQRKRSQPAALIMVPTRELAQQVADVARAYCRLVKLRVAVAYGGAGRGPQESAINHGVDIMIATPGRLTDFVASGVLDLTHCSYLVFDEADRMLDMGFEPQIRKVADQIRPDRQTVMWSATWPREVRQLARSYTAQDMVRMTMGSEDLVANPNIEQIVRVCQARSQIKELQNIINQIAKSEERKTLIFVNTKRDADNIYYRMRDAGFPVTVMHGDKNQTHRTSTMNAFRSGQSEILIATEVAARGIDVSDIRFVVNYDFPNEPENYIHRIGRTARGNQKGTAYTIITEQASPAGVQHLLNVLRDSKQEIPEELYNLAGGGAGRRSHDRSRGRPHRGPPRGRGTSWERDFV